MTETTGRRVMIGSPIRFKLADFRDATRGGLVTAIVDQDTYAPTNLELSAMWHQLGKLGYVQNVSFTVNNADGRVVYAINLKPEGNPCHANYLPEGRREELLRLLNPAYLRTLNVTGEVVRSDSRHHIDTAFTISTVCGEPVTKEEFDAAQLEDGTGVEGVRHAVFVRGDVKITLEEGGLLKDDGTMIPRIIGAVVATLKGYSPNEGPVDIVDHDPDAQLFDEFRYRDV